MKRLLAMAWALVALLSHISAIAYDVPNHFDMSSSAVGRSILATDPNLLSAMGLRNLNQKFPASAGTNSNDFTDRCRHATNFSITNLIACGAQFEDVPGSRSLNHFFDPTKAGSYNDGALTAGSLYPRVSSPQWALAPRSTISAQANSYGDAREYFYSALTKNPSTQTDRDALWGKLFQSIGQVIHHLQDMAQPQHVRNDTHCDFAPCVFIGQYNPSRYEKYTSSDQIRRGTAMQNFLASGSPVYPAYAPKFTLPRNFWIATGAGIAEFTNSNFVSQGTNFRMESGIAKANVTYSSPRPGAVQPKSVASLYAGQTVPPGMAFLCNNDLVNCFVDFYSSTVTDGLTGASSVNDRASSFSVFDQDLEGAGATVQSIDPTTGLGFSTEKVFSLNRFNFDTAHADLIPRAVGYSAGLINYFFRGKMQISLPDEGVYGIVDHAVAAGNDPMIGGFSKIKLKIQNTTPDPAGQQGVTEPMDTMQGVLRAVAKFHRNTCYAADLSGEYGSPGKDWRACRSAAEEIVVSDPITAPVGINTAATQVAFTFPVPIPISATDLYLQVVYRGPLGPLGGESDAIVVETKDISEPTYGYNYSIRDQVLYAAYPSQVPGSYDYATWCTQGYASATAACDQAMGVTSKNQFSSGSTPVPNYDPATNPVPQGSWTDIAQEAPLSPVLTMVAPVGALNRVAVLMDAVPTNYFVGITESFDTAQQKSLFTWFTGIPKGTICQRDPATDTLTPSMTYLKARGVYLPAAEFPRLTNGNGPMPFKDLVPRPSQIAF